MTALTNVIDMDRSKPAGLAQLETRKKALLGELVISTGAINLPIDALAGALLAAAEENSSQDVAKWTLRGRAFFADGADSRRA